jgi:hypothetical protein
MALTVVAAGLIREQAPTYKIAGQVVREAGNPVRGARVSVFASLHPDQQISCVSGENGQFLFTGIPPGKYSLQVTYHGWRQLYRQNEEFSTGIVVAPGLDTEHIRFLLEASASIVGSVSDDIGDPVRNAMVYLFSRWAYRGMLRTGVKQTKTTGNDGSFHFINLDPGTYYVAVSGRPWYARGPDLSGNGSGQMTMAQPAPELDVAYPVTYYSGVTSADAATPIELQHGSRAEIQFRLQAVPAVHAAFEGIDKQPDQHISGAILQAGPAGAMISVESFLNDTGVSGIPPGNYVISLSLVGGKSAAPLGTKSVRLFSDSPITMGRDTDASLSGKVILESPVPDRVAVLLEGTTNSNQSFNMIDQNGSFQMHDIVPGRYNVRLANTPELYLKSVLVKGADYTHGVLEVKQGERIEMTIEAAKGVCDIDGIATRDGKGVEAAMVLAVPQTYAHGNYIPRDQSDSNGSFSLRYAPPGRYTVIAVEDGRNLEYANPQIMAPYLAHGRTVDVPVAPNTRVEVEVQPRNR